MPRFLQPPQFPDIRQTQQAATFHAVAWPTLLIVTALLMPLAILDPASSFRAIVTIVSIDLVVLFTVALNHQGRTRLASWIFIVGLLARVTVNSYMLGGISSPGVGGYYIFPVLAGVLIGQSAGAFMAFVCCGLALAFVYLERIGRLPAHEFPLTPLAVWLVRCVYLGCAVWLVRVATRSNAAALAVAETELAARKKMEVERERAEQHRQDLESQLRQSQKMEALGTLAGGIAHDFNNILMAILGNAALASDEIADGKVRTYLDEIDQAGQRGADLVKRILLFGRRAETARQPIRIGLPVSEAIALLRTNKPASVQITAAFAPDLPLVSGDATQLHQVFMNLGTNAIHAMRASGGQLTFVVEPMTFDDMDTTPASLPLGRYVRIAVGDTGTGMSQDVANRLFEPFFTTKIEGTGLGLSVAHGIVRDHGGVITVTSTIGQGTVFTIYLPATTEPAVDARPDSPAIIRGSGEHVLFVDDEEPLVFLMTQVLERLGYRCSGFSSPEQALEAFRRDPVAFDAVVTDLTMPNMTGVDLAHRLRAIRPDVPIAIASGFGRTELLEAARRITHVRLQKPASTQAISLAMRALLEHETGA